MRNKNWVKRILLSILGFVIVFIPVSGMIFENGVLDLPGIAAHLYARENCMCIFISGFSEEVCREQTRQMIPAGSIEVNVAEKSVRTRVFWKHSQFRLKNAQLGCEFIF